MSSVAIHSEGIGKRYSLATRPRDPSDPAAELTPVTIRSRIRNAFARREEFWALRDVSFDVKQGEVFGVIGANGAGKSTLLKIFSQITHPTEGRAEIRGRVSSLLEVGTGFHPDLSGRDNVFLNGAILGMKRAEIARKFDEIVDFAGVENFIDVPVKWYSSGMYVRLAFAVAAHLEPEILIVDEVLSVGDISFQRRSLGRMDEIAHSGRTVLFVSHNLTSVASLCSSACMLEHGRMVESGPVDRVIERYVASTRRETVRNLAHRTDRQGNGLLRFTEIEFGTPGETLAVGSDAEIRLDYVAESDLSHVLVSIAFYGPMGEPLFMCSSRVSGQEFERIPRRGSFRCAIPRFPLAPGTYSMNVYAEVNGVVADWVQHARAFDVVESDFFGSGQLPPTSHGYFVADHSWALVEPALREVGAAKS